MARIFTQLIPSAGNGCCFATEGYRNLSVSRRDTPTHICSCGWGK